MKTRQREGAGVKRRDLFPPPAHMAQCEAIVYLRRNIFDVATAAKLLVPCVPPKGKGCEVLYRFEDVRDVSLMVAAGNWPPVKKQQANAGGEA